MRKYWENKRFRVISIISLAVFAVLVAAYVLFLKPNPVLRVNVDRIEGADREVTMDFDTPDQVIVGKNFIVTLILDTRGNHINAMKAYLDFDPRVLEVTNIDTTASFCQFYIEKSYDNTKGTVKLTCGTPYPGYAGKNGAVKISFLPKAAFDTNLAINNASEVLANDGKGTELLKQYTVKKVNISQAF